MERGLLEIYRFVPPPLLETFDPETIDDVDEFLGWVAKARFMQELEEGIVAGRSCERSPSDDLPSPIVFRLYLKLEVKAENEFRVRI